MERGLHLRGAAQQGRGHPAGPLGDRSTGTSLSLSPLLSVSQSLSRSLLPFLSYAGARTTLLTTPQDKIFRLLGSPSEQIWPGFSKLPNAKNIRFSQYQPYNYLRKKVGPITELCFDLLNAMLTYYPKKRITAAEALKHPYWRHATIFSLLDILQIFCESLYFR